MINSGPVSLTSVGIWITKPDFWSSLNSVKLISTLATINIGSFIYQHLVDNRLHPDLHVNNTIPGIAVKMALTLEQQTGNVYK